MMNVASAFSIIALLLASAACSSGDASTATDAGAHDARTDATKDAHDDGAHDGAKEAARADAKSPDATAPATTVEMNFDRKGQWLAAPFPSDDLRRADGTVDLSTYPNPTHNSSVSQVIALASSAHGFAQSGGVFFAMTGPLDATKLPTLAESVSGTATTFLIDVDPQSPEYLKRKPAMVSFVADGGRFGAPNLLSVVPLQGIPLRPGTRYAAVVRREQVDAKGEELVPSPGLAPLLAVPVDPPPGHPLPPAPAWFMEYGLAIDVLVGAGVATSDLAGLAVFTTDTELAAFSAVRQSILAQPLPAPLGPWQLTDTFPTFCVFQTTIGMPDYQSGTPPFTTTGGTWAFDTSGSPILQRTEPSNLYATVPRQTMPANGFPTVAFIRTGAGGNRPLVDRGVSADPTYSDGDALVPGTGPALYFAREGFAGLEVDGPLGGLRNTTNANEDFTIFNVENLGALRDNVRESAVELDLFAHIAPSLTFDASACAGYVGGPVTFDPSHLALMGHSMGATILPLTFSTEPAYGEAILSGAGASYIANLLYKQLPIPVLPAVDLILGYPAGEKLSMGDPMLSMIQWALEPSDPLIYTAAILHDVPAGGARRSVLMEQGIIDHYNLPPMANGTSLSLGLDLAGTELDTESALAAYTPLGELLTYSGGSSTALPAQGNWAGDAGTAVTALVVQHPSDGIQDGHEIVFQTDPPKHEYECFLASSLTGTPKVPNGGSADAGCP
jgi:hypothetical protein